MMSGARCYYFRSIFHDWPDADCITILKNTAAAMSPGYSKLLMSEFVLPTTNCPLYPALLDINMMGKSIFDRVVFLPVLVAFVS